MAGLDVFVHESVCLPFDVTSVKNICLFPERICGTVETTRHGKETCRLTSISIQIEGKKPTLCSPIDQ